MLAAGVGGLVEEMVFARWLLGLINPDPVQVHLQLGVTIVVRCAKPGEVKTTTIFYVTRNLLLLLEEKIKHYLGKNVCITV
jgi:hypothetical protein